MIVSGLTVSLSVDKVVSTQTFLNRFQDPLGIDISAIFIGNSAEHFQFQGNVVPGDCCNLPKINCKCFSAGKSTRNLSFIISTWLLRLC